MNATSHQHNSVEPEDDINLTSLAGPDGEFWWEFRDPPRGTRFDSIEGFLRGEMRDATAESVLYVARLKNYSGYIKIGTAQLKTRSLRIIDPEIGEVIWESCRFEDLIVYRGNLTRAEAWISEQLSLHEGQRWRQAVPALRESRWPGYTETFYVPTTDEENELIRIVENSVGLFGLMGRDGLELGVRSLAISNEAQELYQFRLQQILEDIVHTADNGLSIALASGDDQKIRFWKWKMKAAEYYWNNQSFAIDLPNELRLHP